MSTVKPANLNKVNVYDYTVEYNDVLEVVRVAAPNIRKAQNTLISSGAVNRSNLESIKSIDVVSRQVPLVSIPDDGSVLLWTQDDGPTPSHTELPS